MFYVEGTGMVEWQVSVSAYPSESLHKTQVVSLEAESEFDQYRGTFQFKFFEMRRQYRFSGVKVGRLSTDQLKTLRSWILARDKPITEVQAKGWEDHFPKTEQV